MFQMGKSMGLAAILVAYIFLLVPFSLYIGNINEFTVSYTSMVQAYVPAMIFIIAAFGLLGMLLPSRVYNRYAILLAATGILLWAQSNLLVWDYGLLDGRAINWSRDAWRSWLEIVIWASGLLLVLVFYRSIGRRVIGLAILLFVLQLGIFGYNWAGHASELAKKSEVTHTNQSLDELFQFSSQKNVVHILADGFQSDIFEDIIADGDEGDRMSAAMDGFTFFRDHLGVFPYTHMSVPAILTSKIYRNQVPINEFMDSALSKKSIFNAAYDAGFDVDLVVPGGLLYMYKKGRYTNLSTVPGQQYISKAEIEARGAAKLLDLSLFRLSPQILKKRIYNDQRWLMQTLFFKKNIIGGRFFEHKDFLRSLHENLSADRTGPVYKYLHLMLSHNPMVANEQCEYAGRVLATVRETVKTQARCGLIEILKLFEEMKRAGIYNDALIILMADHGAWVPPRGLTGIPVNDGKSTEVINPEVMALAQPLLAIKRPGETGVLRISDAPSWILDIAATIAGVMELDTEFDGLSVFELQQNDERKRGYFFYQYQRSEWTDDFLSPIQEFSIIGKAVDSSSWHEGAIHLPAGRTLKNQGKSSLWQTVKNQE